MGATLLVAACSSPPPRYVGNSFCAARVGGAATPIPLPPPGKIQALAAHGLPEHAVQLAGTIGALDALEAMLAAERRSDRIEFLIARQGVTDRVLLAALDVNASLAAIDCEGERGDSLRGHLQRIADRRSRNLGLASILLGATTAALGGGLGLAGVSAGENIVGIVGGAAEASIGGALLYGSASGRLHTRANPLGELRRQPEHSNIFPPTVWRYLTQRDSPTARNIAEEIIHEWREAGLFREDDPLFAAEGEFSVSDLERRDAMLDLLEARIALMSRDLRTLLEQVVERRTPARDERARTRR